MRIRRRRSAPEAAADPHGPGLWARRYARVVVAGRHVIVAVWIVLAFAATTLPPLSDPGGS